MSEDKPWEDESLKGAYYEKKKEFAQRMNPPPKKAAPPAKPAKPGLTDAYGQAEDLAAKRKKIADRVGGWSKK